MVGAARETGTLSSFSRFFTAMAKPDFSTEENRPRHNFFMARTCMADFLPCPCSQETLPNLHPQQRAKQHYGIRLPASLLPGQEVMGGGGLPDLPALAGKARSSLGTSTRPRFLSYLTNTSSCPALSNCTSHNKAPGSNNRQCLGRELCSAPSSSSFHSSQATKDSPSPRSALLNSYQSPTCIVLHLLCRQSLKQLQKKQNCWVYTSEDEEAAPRAHPSCVGLQRGGGHSVSVTEQLCKRLRLHMKNLITKEGVQLQNRLPTQVGLSPSWEVFQATQLMANLTSSWQQSCSVGIGLEMSRASSKLTSLGLRNLM